MKIIAGLGNPGPRYRDTRHNAGWMALAKLAERCEATPQEYDGKGILARRTELWFFKPLSYMNRSGPSVARLLEKLGTGAENLLVLVDDLNLPLGAIRLRPGGSGGGHKGLASLIEAFGTERFPRLRMGIGLCPQQDKREFVLSPFAPQEWDIVEIMTDLAAQAALCWAEQGIEVAMDRFNRKVENEPDS